MRILVVVHGFPPLAQGGSEIYARAHALAMRACFGDEILVLTREANPKRPEYETRTETRDGLRIVWVNNTFRSTRTFEETYKNTVIGAIASRVIDDFRPDVAHVHHLTCLSTTVVQSLAERRIPCFVTLHDYWLICHRGQLLDENYRVCEGPEKQVPAGCAACLGAAGGAGPVSFMGATMLRALERRLPAAPARQLRQAMESAATAGASRRRRDDEARKRVEHMREVCAGVTHFLAPSQCMRNRFIEFGVAPERITLSKYGFDLAMFERVRRQPSNRLRLGFLGSLMASKAPHVLLEAIDRLPRGSVSVDLFGAHSAYHGDDSYRLRLEPLVNREGVRVQGAVAHDRVPEALASIDVLVVPSIWPENSPLVIQEAFLARVPVVASRIGGIPEVVIDGANGLLFEPGNAADLARALSRLVHEPDLLETLRSGIPPVRTLEEDVRMTRNLYADHLTRRSVPPRLAAVVLNFQAPDDTFLAVRSLLASRRKIDEIIVVDNDPRDGARDVLHDVLPRIEWIRAGANLGFSGGMNLGIRAALSLRAKRVLLVNSDVIVPPDCIDRLEQCLDASPEIGIAGPIVLARSEPERIATLGMSYAPFSGRMRHHGAGALVGAYDLPVGGVVDAVSGCLMLVKREVFDTVGLLDEDYFFSFEDLDFCLKARRAGFVTSLAGAATAYHEGGRSIGAESPSRLYFAARNHLLAATRADPATGRAHFLWRAVSIVALNVAHAVIAPGGSLLARLQAVVRGTRDYMSGRFGADPTL